MWLIEVPQHDYLCWVEDKSRAEELADHLRACQLEVFVTLFAW